MSGANAVLRRLVLTRAFTLTLATLGWLYLFSSVAVWHSEDLRRYLIYLSAGLVAGAVMGRKAEGQTTFSANLLLVPLGIVELSRPETMTLAVAGVLVQYLASLRATQGLQMALAIGIEATAVTAADFAYHFVLPGGAKSVAVRLFLAGGAFFVTKTFPIAAMAAVEKQGGIGKVWKKRHFWSFPHYFVGASAAGFLSIRNSFLHWEACVLIAPVLYVLYRAHRMQEAGVEHERELFAEIRALHVRTIETLSLTMEAKDDYTGGHLNRVQTYAVELAKDLGLSEQEAEALRAAALLHDIGKLAVPDSILSKPAKLTPEEFAKIKIHPIVGAEILDHAHFPYAVAPIVRAHHEKWDGSGYPEGLKGEEIPLGARILSAVDCLDALSSERRYRSALSLDEAMERVAAEAGRSYDPRVVAALKRRYRELEQMVQARAEAFPKLSKNAVVVRGAAPAAGFIDPIADEDELMRMAENVGLSPGRDAETTPVKTRLDHFIEAQGESA